MMVGINITFCKIQMYVINNIISVIIYWDFKELEVAFRKL